MNLYESVFRLSSAPLDYYERGLVAVTNESKFGRGVIATQDVFVDHKQKLLIGHLKGCLITKEMLSQSPPNLVCAYSVNLSVPNLLVLMTTHWSGRMNYICSKKANVLVEDHNIYLIKSVKKGEELRWDYGFEYLVFMITHLEIHELSSSTVELFEKIYENTEDYSILFADKLYEFEGERKIAKYLRKYVEKNVSQQ
jgi:hypothetical protein